MEGMKILSGRDVSRLTFAARGIRRVTNNRRLYEMLEELKVDEAVSFAPSEWEGKSKPGSDITTRYSDRKFSGKRFSVRTLRDGTKVVIRIA